MTKKSLGVYLAVGILAGLFVTACAGVTTGKFDLAAPGDTLLGGPAVDTQTFTLFYAVQLVALDRLHSPAVDTQTFTLFYSAQPAQSAQFTFEKAEPVQPAGLPSVVTGQSALESLTQMQSVYHSGRMCSAGYGD